LRRIEILFTFVMFEHKLKFSGKNWLSGEDCSDAALSCIQSLTKGTHLTVPNGLAGFLHHENFYRALRKP
jgi:hypothetical protein